MKREPASLLALAILIALLFLPVIGLILAGMMNNGWFAVIAIVIFVAVVL